MPLRSEKREILNTVSTPPMCIARGSKTPPIFIAVLLGKSWWLWSPRCSPVGSTSIIGVRKSEFSGSHKRGDKGGGEEGKRGRKGDRA